MPLTLRQLKNKYASETGRITRELGNAEEAKLAQIQLKNRMCFETYLAILSIKDAEEKESYEEFLDSIRDTEVPAEALLCAAVYSDMDSEHGGDLHIALQWAVIQFLDEAKPLKDVNWLAIITKLLDLGADPRVESTHLSRIVSARYFVGELNDLKSAFLMASLFKTKNQHTLELLELFSKYRGVTLSDKQFDLIFPIDNTDDKSVLVQRPWFKWFEKNFFQQMQSCFKKNECERVYYLALNEDFESLTHLEAKYKLNVFWELLNRTITNHYQWRLSLKPTVRYLETYHSDKLATFLIEKKDDSSIKHFFIDNDFLDTLQRVTRDPTSHTQLIFDRLYDLSSKSIPTKTPGISLGCYAGNITITRAFRWLETNNPSAIRAFFNNFQRFREAADSSEARIYLANFLNIDCYYLLTKPNILPEKFFSTDEKTTVAPFYQQRAKFVLDYMFNQPFSADGSGITVFHDGKCMTGLSGELHRIFELLQTILACPKGETADACMKVYVAAKECLETAADPIEEEFLSALASGLTNQSPLSLYVQREFDIHRICVPFLTGLRSNVRKLETKDESKGDSSIFRASMNPLWDRRLLAGEIFRFLGFDPPRQQLKEKKEAKQSLSPAPNWP